MILVCQRCLRDYCVERNNWRRVRDSFTFVIRKLR
jgi:hypothetical protein